MIQLTSDESRVLGVLIEKALTTPEQYPLTLNAAVAGCNQKSNRDPVLAMDETAVFDALEGLRTEGLVARVDSVGSRTNRYKQMTAEALRLRMSELVVLAELLLRGPQTVGELRGRASRMHALESVDTVKQVLRALMDRPEPMVKEVPPSPGSRAERYVQLLCPDLHPLAPPAPSGDGDLHHVGTGEAPMGERVAKLEAEVAMLRAAILRLATALGEADPITPLNDAGARS